MRCEMTALLDQSVDSHQSIDRSINQSINQLSEHYVISLTRYILVLANSLLLLLE